MIDNNLLISTLPIWEVPEVPITGDDLRKLGCSEALINRITYKGGDFLLHPKYWFWKDTEWFKHFPREILNELREIAGGYFGGLSLEAQCDFLDVKLLTIEAQKGEMKGSWEWDGQDMDTAGYVLAFYKEQGAVGHSCEGLTYQDWGIITRERNRQVWGGENLHKKINGFSHPLEHNKENADLLILAFRDIWPHVMDGSLDNNQNYLSKIRTNFDVIRDYGQVVGFDLLEKMLHHSYRYGVRGGYPDVTIRTNDELHFIEAKAGDKLRGSQARWYLDIAKPLGLNFSVVRLVKSKKARINPERLVDAAGMYTKIAPPKGCAPSTFPIWEITQHQVTCGDLKDWGCTDDLIEYHNDGRLPHPGEWYWLDREWLRTFPRRIQAEIKNLSGGNFSELALEDQCRILNIELINVEAKSTVAKDILELKGNHFSAQDYTLEYFRDQGAIAHEFRDKGLRDWRKITERHLIVKYGQSNLHRLLPKNPFRFKGNKKNVEFFLDGLKSVYPHAISGSIANDPAYATHMIIDMDAVLAYEGVVGLPVIETLLYYQLYYQISAPHPEIVVRSGDDLQFVVVKSEKNLRGDEARWFLDFAKPNGLKFSVIRILPARANSAQSGSYPHERK